MSDETRESPFPIGCPSGFFQEGNVCVPIIGTYPDETYGAPPAGQNFARGAIDHIEVPATVTAGQKFKLFVFMRNIGAIRGKFGVALVIDTWNIDVVSPQGWVPRYTPAVIEIEATCPLNATLGDGTVPATIELQKLDEVTREYEIDDLGTANIPQPTGTTPPPEPECFTWNNVEYCETDEPSGTGCLTIGTKTYCPTTQPQPQCFTFNNIEYCESTTGGAGCITIGNKLYCPTTQPQPQCFTFNNIQYCESTTGGAGCMTIGNKIYCPVNQPEPQCFVWNNVEYCESDEIISPNCVQIGTKIFCPTGDVPCSAGYERVNGTCIPKCPTGYERNSVGACIPTCPTGYERNAAGACVPQVCPTGKIFDPSTGNCVNITCPTGYHLEGNNCVQNEITCPTGYVKQGNVCVPITCPTGQQFDVATGTCKPIQCPSGYDLVNGQCVPKICPIGKVLDPTTGNCVPITCPTGYHLEGSTCIPNTPPPPPQCITISGQEYCQSEEWRHGCIFQNGKIYCKPYVPPPPPPPEDPATLMAPDAVHDGDSFTVKGYKFKAGERVDMILNLVWQSSKDEYDGKRYSDTKYEIASSSGSFSETFKTPEVPSGVSGNAIIRARGQTSGKEAETIVSII
jgi:hypothetical protein